MNTYRIEAPVRSFSGESVGVTFRKGTGFVTDATKEGRAAVEYFRRQGYGVALVEDDKTDEERVQELVTGAPTQRDALSPEDAMSNLGHGAAPSVGLGIGIPKQQPPVEPIVFDPSEHSQNEVLDYLDHVEDPDEIERVQAAEATGKARQKIAAYGQTTTAPAANPTKGAGA